MKYDPISNLDITDHGEDALEEVSELPSDAVPFDENDIDDGFAAARLGYGFNFLFLPFCLIAILRRDNAYSLFHAKQSLALWMGLVGVGIVGQALLFIGIGFWIWLIGFPVLWILNWAGLHQVNEELARPLPLLGLRPQEWFSAQVREDD